MIADMVRVVFGLTAWVAGTVIAVGVASFGANVVLRNAGAGTGIPVIGAALPASSGTPAQVTPAAPTPSGGATAGGTATPRRTTSAPPRPGTPVASGAGSLSPSMPPASPPAASGAVRDYGLAGGRVTLSVTASSVQLVTAVPDAGYSVQTWSGTDWLRVDFSSGAQVSSLIASWYEHAPSITVTS
jgi:hypothetical protein